MLSRTRHLRPEFVRRRGRVSTFAPMDDPRELLIEGRYEELANDDHPLWRGLALLELRRWPQAARTFEEAPDAGQSGTLLELAGAARWLAGEREQAVERWISALDAAYEGPASRLKPQALLVYAGTRMGDERYVLRGTRLLTKTWKVKVQRIWPGPVAGFLLDKIDAKSLIEDGYSDPDLEARRLASAHFWAALKDPEHARQHYEAAVQSEGASVLEVEHHLAHGELMHAR
jgi:HPt (histidine-containing phosphotransfer) domain-containing protein